MFTKKIQITSLEDAKNFVNITTKYEDVNMHLRSDNYEIDAHSIVGVLSIVDSENVITLIANLPDNDKELSADIAPFISKKLSHWIV